MSRGAHTDSGLASDANAPLAQSRLFGEPLEPWEIRLPNGQTITNWQFIEYMHWKRQIDCIGRNEPLRSAGKMDGGAELPTAGGQPPGRGGSLRPNSVFMQNPAAKG